jgi:hypothetical protein
MPRAAKKEEVRIVQCSPGRMKLREHAHNSWSVNAPTGAVPDDVKSSDFWSLMSAKLRPFDRFEVIGDDGSWLVEGRVLSCSRNWAEVVIHNSYTFGKATAPDTSKRYKVEWKGPEMLWCVIRNHDSAVIQDKIERKEDAVKFMSEHEAKVG